MALYRFNTKKENDCIKKSELLKRTPKPWCPYGKNEVVFLFETENLHALFERYAEEMARKENLKAGESIFIIKIDGIDELVEIDESQVGWDESRIYRDDIPLKSISVIGYAKLKRGADTWVEFEEKNPIVFNNPVQIDKFDFSAL